MFCADSQAFFARPGQPPVFGAKRPQINLALVTSASPMFKDLDQTLAAHAAFRQTVLSNPKTYEVLTQRDFDAHPSGIKIVYGLQHAPHNIVVSGDVKNLFNAGIRSMAIAYDDPTPYGDGFKGDGGLTPKGEELIEWMTESGIILDLSHASHATARSALDFIDREELPIYMMASHSGCYEVFPHKRNLPNDVIKRLDYIGIPAVSFLLTEKEVDGLEAFVYHVQHAMSITAAGTSTGVGIGSDCPHVDMTMDEAKMEFGRMQSMLKTNGSFGEYFPDRPQQVIEHGSTMFDTFGKALETVFDGQYVEVIEGAAFRLFLDDSLPS